jgi:hypothetical protein
MSVSAAAFNRGGGEACRQAAMSRLISSTADAASGA